MKTLLKIVFILIICFSFLTDITNAEVAKSISDLKTGGANSSISSGLEKENIPLQLLQDSENDFIVTKGGQEGIYNTLIRIARDLKNLFFLIAGVYFVILVLILLFSDKTEEASSNFKKGIIWISIGIFITQISYYFVNILFDKEIGIELATRFIDIILHPLITLLETSASFVFIAIMLYAFFMIVTSGGDEEKAKSGKMSVLYAFIGFIVVKLSKALVTTTYGKTNCTSISQTNCINDTNIEGIGAIVVRVIDWMNGFVGIIVILIIIYAGFIVITSAGDEEKLKKAKASIMYVVIGLTILFMNYLILTFFILPETTI